MTIVARISIYSFDPQNDEYVEIFAPKSALSGPLPYRRKTAIWESFALRPQTADRSLSISGSPKTPRGQPPQPTTPDYVH